MRRVDSLYARLPTQETLTRRPLCPTRIRTPPAAWDKLRVKRGQSIRRPVPAETGHSLGPTSPPMQTAPPSRIMLGGAVLKPDSAIPRQLSVRGGRNKVRRAEATEAALPVDLSELLLLARRMLKPAVHSGMPPGQVLLFIRLGRPANDAPCYFRRPDGAGGASGDAGNDPRA